MKKYLLDFVRVMWKPFFVAVVAVCASVYSINHHYYVAMSLSGLVVSVVVCIWTPWLEEEFKASHSATKKEAVIYALFELLLYSYQVAGFGVGLFVVFRLPMLVLHLASGLCYYHSQSKRIKLFWYINHSLWNIAASVVPTWLFTGSTINTIRPTLLTICLVLFWGTSMLCKIIRKKAVSC